MVIVCFACLSQLEHLQGAGPNPVGNPITRGFRPDLVEVVDEVVEILFVGFRSQTLSTDPLDVVLLVDAVVVLHLLGQHLVPVVAQQLDRFLAAGKRDKLDQGSK